MNKILLVQSFDWVIGASLSTADLRETTLFVASGKARQSPQMPQSSASSGPGLDLKAEVG